MPRKPKQPSRELPESKFTKTLHSPPHDVFVCMIREARKEAGLSQVEASRKLGVRQSFISDIERGERRVDVIEFVKLCNAYGLDCAAFFRKLEENI